MIWTIYYGLKSFERWNMLEKRMLTKTMMVRYSEIALLKLGAFEKRTKKSVDLQ